MITSKELHLERWLVVSESKIYRNDWNFLVREIAQGRDVDGRPIIAVFEVNSFVVENEPCSGQSVVTHYLSIRCLRCCRTSLPKHPFGILIGLLYTNLCASTVLQRAGAVLWTALRSLQHSSGGGGEAAGTVFSHTAQISICRYISAHLWCRRL